MPRLAPISLLAAWERGIRQTPLQRSLTLLAAAQDDPAQAPAMDVGRRDVLLAQLLETAAGAEVWGRAECGSCGEQLDIPVDVAAIAQLPVPEPGACLSAVVDGTEVRFRLPTTADLAALSGMAPAVANDVLLARCLGVADGPVPRQVAEAVDAAMEQAAPAGALEIIASCPDCGAATTVALDISVLLWAEIHSQAVALINDVHTLATAYGWTEADVLALSPERRAAYLNLAGT